jgi:hypothetical protein
MKKNNILALIYFITQTILTLYIAENKIFTLLSILYTFIMSYFIFYKNEED